MKYDLETQEAEEDQRRNDFLHYDTENHTLAVRIQGGPLEMHRLANVIYRIRIVVEDYLGLKSEKTVQLNITVDEEWFQRWLNRNNVPPDEETVTSVVVGRIIDISVFGEVDIAINQSSPWKPKSPEQLGDLSQISQDYMSLYIEPSEDWHIYYN